VYKVFLFYLIIVFTGFFFLPGKSKAQSDSIKTELYKNIAEQFTKTALTEQTAFKWLDELCNIGPRLSGSENSLKAIYWAEEKLKSLGVDKIWLQPVMVPHWVRGNSETAAIFSPGSESLQSLNMISLGGSVATPENGITAEVIEINNFTELKDRQKEVKGKIVFFSRPLDESLLNTFAGYGGAVDQRFYGAIEAAKYGALAVVIRSITTRHDNVPHTGVMGYVDSLPKIPAASLGYLDADNLHNALINNPSLLLKLNFNPKTLPDTLSYNVIAEITGSEYPDEVIVFGGHFDSWDQGCGAHDDGAGCVQSMEVLKLFKDLNIKPKRTIRCVLFINEENGSRGGKEYGKYSEENKEKHIAVIESDRGGFTPLGFDVDSDPVTLKIIQDWVPVLEKSGICRVKKGGSGVDVQYIKNAKVKIGYVPDAQRYMDVHHSANDTFESVHPRELELGSASIAILTYLISQEGL